MQMKLTSHRPGRADPAPCDGPCESHSSSPRRCACEGNDTAATLSSLPNRPSPWKRPGGPYSDTSAGYTVRSGRPQTHDIKLCEHTFMSSSKRIQWRSELLTTVTVEVVRHCMKLQANVYWNITTGVKFKKNTPVCVCYGTMIITFLIFTNQWHFWEFSCPLTRHSKASEFADPANLKPTARQPPAII